MNTTCYIPGYPILKILDTIFFMNPKIKEMNNSKNTLSIRIILWKKLIINCCLHNHKSDNCVENYFHNIKLLIF